MGKKLNIISTAFEGLYIIEPICFKDDRGAFSRIFCENELRDILDFNIKQINYSVTEIKGTVRGLHFQYEPFAEIKIIKCIRGAIFDIAVDIRKNSPTFLKHFTIELSQKNQKMLCIPKGFAHGFQALRNKTELLYLHTHAYTPSHEGALNIKDPALNITLPIPLTNISERDNSHPLLSEKFNGVTINEL